MNIKKYLIFIILSATVILLNLPLPASMRVKEYSQDNFVPFQNMMSFVLNKGRELVSSLRNAKKTANEKKHIFRELAILCDRVRELEGVERENEDLRTQLGFAKRSRRKLIFCEIIARGDISGWWQTVRLNKGANDGIARNTAVITAKGLIGRTMYVARKTCNVLLITDSNSRVSCKLSRTGAFGIVKGAGASLKGEKQVEMLCSAGPLRMDYIHKNQKLQRGDEVVTSGLGGIYPEGMLVGYAGKMKINRSGLYQCVEILPAADLRALKYVFVVAER